MAGLLVGCSTPGPVWSGWAQRRGGICQGDLACRAQAMGRRMAEGVIDRPIQVYVLGMDEASAYSFSTGDVFITRGFAERASDRQLAAAIAHELGHLIENGHRGAPAGLRGAGQEIDEEARADAVGVRVLARQGIAPEAMVEALELLQATATPAERVDLQRRIVLLGGRAR